VAPKVSPKLVKEVAEIVNDIDTDLTGSDISKLAEMAQDLSHPVTAAQVSVFSIHNSPINFLEQILSQNYL
jgi:hypothetical protein